MAQTRTPARLDFGAAGNWNEIEFRVAHPTSTLADLYDPLPMPPNLRKAHNDLDRAVDRLYRSKPFEDDPDRVALLLRRYQALVGG